MPFFKGKKIKTFKIFCKILPLKSHLARKAETYVEASLGRIDSSLLKQ